jgi:hypothetical protein
MALRVSSIKFLTFVWSVDSKATARQRQLAGERRKDAITADLRAKPGVASGDAVDAFPTLRAPNRAFPLCEREEDCKHNEKIRQDESD